MSCASCTGSGKMAPNSSEKVWPQISLQFFQRGQEKIRDPLIPIVLDGTTGSISAFFVPTSGRRLSTTKQYPWLERYGSEINGISSCMAS